MDSISDFLSSLLGQGAELGFSQALIAMAVAYLGGILSSLTPCIYPMIPITLSVAGGLPISAPGHAGHDTRKLPRRWGRIVGGGLAYVFGMTVIYSFLGVLAGLTGKVFGSLTNTPGWYVGLGIVMSAAGLMMMDVFSFDPQVWIERVRRKLTGSKPSAAGALAATRETTLFSAFILGASSGFIAAPCTTPVLTAILAYVAKTQSVGLGLALMTMFSLGLGTILLAIAAFAGLLRVMPRSGGWMEGIKKASGLILLGFAHYLFYRAGALGGL